MQCQVNHFPEKYEMVNFQEMIHCWFRLGINFPLLLVSIKIKPVLFHGHFCDCSWVEIYGENKNVLKCITDLPVIL